MASPQDEIYQIPAHVKERMNNRRGRAMFSRQMESASANIPKPARSEAPEVRAKEEKDRRRRIRSIQGFFRSYPKCNLMNTPIELKKGQKIFDAKKFVTTNLKTLKHAEGHVLICTLERLEALRDKLQ